MACATVDEILEPILPAGFYGASPDRDKAAAAATAAPPILAAFLYVGIYSNVFNQLWNRFLAQIRQHLAVYQMRPHARHEPLIAIPVSRVEVGGHREIQCRISEKLQALVRIRAVFGGMRHRSDKILHCAV